MSQWVKIAKTGTIPVGQMRAFEVSYERIVLCHSDKGFFALANECSHDAAPISDGILRGDEVICSRHGARFRVTDGNVTAPPAVVGIDSYPVKVEGEDIYVLIA